MSANVSIELYTSGIYETMSAYTVDGIRDRQLVEPAGDPAARLQAITWLLANMRRRIDGMPPEPDAPTLLATIEAADNESRMTGITQRYATIEID